MLGTIIGDIAGSQFEFNNHRNKNFDLFTDDCCATDDSIVSLAIAKAIMETSRAKPRHDTKYDEDYYSLLSDMTVKYMQEIGREYPGCGFGRMFHDWIFSDDPQPYNSFGNGAAMRVSPAGFAAIFEWDAIYLAEAVTAVTHNHDEGLKGAKAVAIAIEMARKGALKREIRDRIVAGFYSLDFRIDDIRSTYRFKESCQETVPQAIECFLEATSFEDAIRTAISLGGDSDTIGAITGSIAEAYYGVPDSLKETALSYLDDKLRALYDEWTLFAPLPDEKFAVLTKYIGKFSVAASLEEWLDYPKHDNTSVYSILFPFINHADLLNDFKQEFEEFIEANPEYGLSNYKTSLQKGVWQQKALENNKTQHSVKPPAATDNRNEKEVLSLIMNTICTGQSDSEALAEFLESGNLIACLKRLKDIDWARKRHQISQIVLEIGSYFIGYITYCLTFSGDGATLIREGFYSGDEFYDKTHFSVQDARSLQKRFEAIHTEYWNHDYQKLGVLDGEEWKLVIRYSDGFVMTFFGGNAYPENWEKFLGLFGIECGDDGEAGLRCNK